MRYELTDYEWAAIRPMLPNGERHCSDFRLDSNAHAPLSPPQFGRTVLQQN
jgi:transposase